LTRGKWLLAASTLILIAALAFVGAEAWRPSLPAIAPPSPKEFDRALVAQGEAMADIGNCAGCHTAQGGRPLAGGRPLPTPFGAIHSTNITPDAQTGIGGWSREAFVRAMREGIARDGAHLYPAFPYDHFTNATDHDLEALYAFLMTRPAVQARAPANDLKWPLDFRPLVAGWNLLYLKKGPMADQPGQTAEWNRGRNLVEGLAHCSDCHSPRNGWGAEKRDEAYDGAWIEGWYAPPLNAHSPAVRAWTADELFTYLRTGLSHQHAAAAGPMASVTQSLAKAPDEDVRAISVYVASLMANAPSAQPNRRPLDREDIAAKEHPEAASLFAGACAVCHDSGAPMMQQGRPSLSWGTALHVDTPHDTLHVIMEGLRPPAGKSGPVMPAFADNFSDWQIADIAAYLRARYTERPPWPDVVKTVGELRRGGTP
jgi:mono/diheme cytochrome c family protein